jgi:gliding motility-associated-like protein
MVCTLNVAQVVSDGWIYGQAGRQTSHLMVVDDEDNRYQFFTSTTAFTIDSAGIPIQILPDRGCVLVKFNERGIYQNHIIINLPCEYTLPYMTITKDISNNILLGMACQTRDTLWVLNKHGVRIKNIFTPDPLQANPFSFASNGLVIIKLDKSLLVKWSLSIHKRNNRSEGQPGSNARNGLSINQAHINKLTFNFINHRNKLGTSKDSIIFTNNAGQQNIIEATTRDILFSIDTNGNYINIHEPFFGKLKKIEADTNFYQDRDGFHILQHDNKAFLFRTFDIFISDTFKVNSKQSIPMSFGYNVIIAQWDLVADSFDWAYKVDYDSQWFTYPVGLGFMNIYRWSYDPLNKELLFAAKPVVRYTPNYLPSKYTNQELNDAEIHLVKINVAGNIVWENIYQNWYMLEEIYYYPPIKGFVFLGSSFSIDSVTFGDLKFKPVSFSYLAILDSLSTPASISNISRNRSYFPGGNVNFMPPNYFTVNHYTRYNTDTKDNIYITGYIERDSIVLRCRTLTSTLQQDAIVLSISPIISIDTFTCRSLISPSLRYVWDSTGIYYDTLQNIAGCDSIIRFNLTIGQSKRTIDTSVCYSMRSPSGRYVWDSSGTYRDTIPNHLGCDSLLTVRLQVKHTRNTITQTHCGPLTSPSTRFVMDTTGVYKDTLVNQSGCDSLLTINFTQLRQTDTSLRDTFVCSYFVTQRGDTISTNRIFADTLQTSTGCDSIIRYRLHIGDSTATIDTAICSSYTSPSGNYIFTQPGTYFDTITKPSGCNLYYTIHIIQPLLNSTIDTSWCGMFTTPSGKVVSPPGIFYDTIPSYRGCDSVLMLRIASSTIQQLIDTSICHTYVSPSGNYQWFAPGVYYDTLTNALGCDTIFEIRIALDTFSVRISKSNELTCQTPDITLTADAGNRFVWSPSEFLNATNLQTVVSTPQRAMQYRLTAYNATGCEATDSVSIADDRTDIQLKIANVFTPNDDGLNDDFTVYPQEDVAELNLRIYNRWGALVFETDKPNTTWKGTTSNGTESPSGVYYYIAKGKDRCGKLFEANGTVSLIR